jgi:uncharacterized protein (DUF433 family)
VERTERGLSIAGTRITLYAIMDYVTADFSREYIRDIYRLTDEQIDDVLRYIAKHRAQVDAEYQQVLQQAEENRRYWEERNRERFAALAEMPPRTDHPEARAKLATAKAKRQRS